MALSRGTSAFTLKMAAIAGMTCNHVANIFGDVMAPAATVFFFTLGGLTFPIMAFLLCEGYRHTSSIRRYATRLALFAVIAEVPWFLLWGPSLNVLFTLLIGLGLLWAGDHLRRWAMGWCLWPALLPAGFATGPLRGRSWSFSSIACGNSHAVY